jgi:hypothetical protein
VDSQDRHSVFVDWPPGASVDDVEVRYVRSTDGVSATWVEVERIPHPPDIDRLLGRIEVVFKPPD